MDAAEIDILVFARASFGSRMRKEHFAFADEYHPLNHGSFGTFPKAVQEYQRRLQSASEARPDTFIRYTYLELLNESRRSLAPLLGADPREVVLVPNATIGVNTVLRNITFRQNDTITYFNTIYGACQKTIESLSETSPLYSHEIHITYPIEDGDILRRFDTAVQDVKEQGKRPKIAMFDTVLTFPGARFPWEALVATCKDLGIVSFIDGAHGVGHMDLTHLGSVGPDFMVSNGYKWLMVPRGCAVLYVPFRNQGMISTTVPTSWAYKTPDERVNTDPHEYFSRLFDKVSTIDNTPYCCIPLALKFRSEACGGEAAIRD